MTFAKRFLVLFSVVSLVVFQSAFADTSASNTQATNTNSSSAASTTQSTDQSYPMTPVGAAPTTQVGSPMTQSAPQPNYQQPTPTYQQPAPTYAQPQRSKLGSDSPDFGGWDPVMQPLEFGSSMVHSIFESIGCMVQGKKVPRGWERQMPQQNQ